MGGGWGSCTCNPKGLLLARGSRLALGARRWGKLHLRPKGPDCRRRCRSALGGGLGQLHLRPKGGLQALQQVGARAPGGGGGWGSCTAAPVLLCVCVRVCMSGNVHSCRVVPHSMMPSEHLVYDKFPRL